LNADLGLEVELAHRIQSGDQHAELVLVERFARPVRLILLKRTSDPQLASDLAQDTFVIVINALRQGKLHSAKALPAFIRQTAINLSIEHFRKEKRYVRQDDEIIQLQAPHVDHKAEQVDRQHARTLLEAALEQLAQPRDREILHRFYLLDEEKPQICDALELSTAHFDRVLYRAKQRMRELLRDNLELKSLLFGGLSDG